ncbi:hypothetical protein HFO27_36175 [Rhizobium leguminosarum]|nr:hypothetical protein [Rhizobium leguminosarum]
MRRRARQALEVGIAEIGRRDRLILHVHHYPPGISKWNKIEHRLFCHITQNWHGRPLESRLAVVELIGATTTKTGLKVGCALDTRTHLPDCSIDCASHCDGDAPSHIDN